MSKTTMAVMFVGMAEVSSNEITVYEAQPVAKGEQLGEIAAADAMLLSAPKFSSKFNGLDHKRSGPFLFSRALCGAPAEPLTTYPP